MISEDLFAPRLLPGETRCLANIQCIYRAAALQAIKECGLAVEWRETPNEWMCPTQAHRYGSVWSAEQHVRPFWVAYRRIRDREDEIDNRRERR